MKLTAHMLTPVLLNGSHGAPLAEWRGRFFANRHRQFVKGSLPCRAYTVEFWPSAIRH